MAPSPDSSAAPSAPAAPAAPGSVAPPAAPVAPPRVLTVAGSDSGGGAGIQADLKTMLALGTHGMSVVTAVTAQNSLGVQGAWELPAEAVRAQFRSVVDDIGVQAVKTGMLASAELVEAVAELLAGVAEPVVVDPVGVSKHGDPLLAADALDSVRTKLLPAATVATPNLDEVTQLTGIRVTSEAGMREAAEAVLAYGPQWALIKGGHLRGGSGGAAEGGPGGTSEGGARGASEGGAGAGAERGPGAGVEDGPEGGPGGGVEDGPEGGPGGGTPGEAVDLLTDGSEEHWLRAPRYDNRHTHGTGCTLASALAAGLARGLSVPAAARAAKAYVTGALAAGFPLGEGLGPVDHGWRIRGSDGS